MLERIVAQIAIALFGWLDKRLSRGHLAKDADVDRDSLRRAAGRINDWMRQQDRVRSGGLTDAGGRTGGSTDEGLPPDRRRVDQVGQQDHRP